LKYYGSKTTSVHLNPVLGYRPKPRMDAVGYSFAENLVLGMKRNGMKEL